ncbi:hypothetical protein VPHD518_0110 [Vibrio phage D518]
MILQLISKPDASHKGSQAYYVRMFKDTAPKVQIYYLSHKLNLARFELNNLLTKWDAELHPKTKEQYAMDIIDPGYLKRTLEEQFNEIFGT